MSRRSSEDEVQSRATQPTQDARLKNRAVRHAPLKEPSVMKRFSLISKKTIQSIPLATNLPNEILLLIFRSIPRRRLDPSIVGPRPKDDLRRLPLVCKGWYGAATRVFYEVVEFHRVGDVFHFYRSLKERPHLRGLVKSLYLPVRTGRDCPTHLRRVFTQIIHLVESLEELHTLCFKWYDTTQSPLLSERYVLPIERNRHPDIRVLSLYGEALGWCPLLPTMLNSSFERLEKLELRNFIISTEVLADTMPIFPCLTSISWIVGIGFTYLDSWLHACPRLHRISLRSERFFHMRSQQEAPLRILRDNRITHLELSHMYTYDPSYQPFKWLTDCTNLREFRTNWDMLQGHATSFPLSLETLYLSLTRRNTPSLELLEEFVQRSSSLVQVELHTCKHDKWISQNRANLYKLFESANVGLRLKYRKTCSWCQPVVSQVAMDVVLPVVKWGWGHAMRLAKQQTKETLEWEYPHMK